MVRLWKSMDLAPVAEMFNDRGDGLLGFWANLSQGFDGTIAEDAIGTLDSLDQCGHGLVGFRSDLA